MRQTQRNNSSLYFDIVDFRLFSNIAEQTSITRGADLSCLSLPAASNRIKALEQRIGCKLFTRVNQGVVLTDAGRAYLRRARRILLELELLTDDLQSFSSGLVGRLRIQANTTVVTEYLPPVLGKFLQDHPDIKISVQQRLSDEIVRNVRDGIVDLGLISGDLVTTGLETKLFATSRMVAIASIRHPIATLGQVALNELLLNDFVCLLEESATYKWLSREASRLHMPLKVRVQVADWDALCRMVAAGAGIGLVPAVVLPRRISPKEIAITEVVDDWAFRCYQICARDFSALPSFARTFVEALLDEYGAAETASI